MISLLIKNILLDNMAWCLCVCGGGELVVFLYTGCIEFTAWGNAVIPHFAR